MRKFIFRTDASEQIGSGHVIRCLTLANKLREKGFQCAFICRELKGNLIRHIESSRFEVFSLPSLEDEKSPSSLYHQMLPPHSRWLGVNWEADAEQTLSVLSANDFECLIIDHYALDYHWESLCTPFVNSIVVIDDLADRQHHCQLLLDQTLGRHPKDYFGLVPQDTKLLLGTEFALLRDEFINWRPESLLHRSKPKLTRVLVSLGGVDKDNITSRILKQLSQISRLSEAEVLVVVGHNAPHARQVERLCEELPLKCHFMQGVSNMGELLSGVDLAIGAAGGSSWERCTLGVPTLMVILAENQRMIAHQLTSMKAAWPLTADKNMESELTAFFETLTIPELKIASQAAAQISDGQGCNKAVNTLLGTLK